MSEQALELCLIELCRKFIAEQDINCAEAIYQTDRVLENAPEFIHEICELLGYTPSDQ